MEDDIVVTVEVPDVEEPEIVVNTVLETAILIADKIDEARQEETELVYTLESIFSAITFGFSEMNGRLDTIADELATLSALEVAEIIVEEPAVVADEILEVTEELQEEVVIEPEEVEDINEPAPRVQKKERRWL